MNTLTITQVTKLYDVTPRMLRHYEKLGLITPCTSEDYAYRLYDEAAIRRLHQIIILRKLRFSLKQISLILQDNAGQKALQIMRDNIAELDSEIDSLSKVRAILREFTNLLDLSLRTKMSFDLLKDETIRSVIDTLALSKTVLKEK